MNLAEALKPHLIAIYAIAYGIQFAVLLAGHLHFGRRSRKRDAAWNARVASWEAQGSAWARRLNGLE